MVGHEGRLLIDVVFSVVGIFSFSLFVYLNAKIIDNLQNLKARSLTPDLSDCGRVWKVVAVTFGIGGIGLLGYEAGFLVGLYGDYIGSLIAMVGVFYLLWSAVQVTDEAAGGEEA